MGKVLQQQHGSAGTLDEWIGNASGTQQNGHACLIEGRILQQRLRRCASGTQMFGTLVSALLLLLTNAYPTMW